MRFGLLTEIFSSGSARSASTTQPMFAEFILTFAIERVRENIASSWSMVSSAVLLNKQCFIERFGRRTITHHLSV